MYNSDHHLLLYTSCFAPPTPKSSLGGPKLLLAPTIHITSLYPIMLLGHACTPGDQNISDRSTLVEFQRFSWYATMLQIQASSPVWPVSGHGEAKARNKFVM